MRVRRSDRRNEMSCYHCFLQEANSHNVAPPAGEASSAIAVQVANAASGILLDCVKSGVFMDKSL